MAHERSSEGREGRGGGGRKPIAFTYPTLTHVPPSLLFSTIIDLMPYLALLARAAANPPCRRQ